jgi:hypothetical protein
VLSQKEAPHERSRFKGDAGRLRSKSARYRRAETDLKPTWRAEVLTESYDISRSELPGGAIEQQAVSQHVRGQALLRVGNSSTPLELR